MRYYPNALAKASKTSDVCHFSTYESCLTYNQALDVITNWRKQMMVFCAWVDDENGKIVDFSNIVE